MSKHYPVFCICGYSGSGKTTVIEPVIEHLCRKGLKVGIVKHDVHGLNIDQEGKDTDRFFKAGADVVIRGPVQAFFRSHRRGDLSLHDLISKIGPYYDLIIAEGHKTTPIDNKVWLCSEDGEGAPPDVPGVQCVLKREDDRINIVTKMIDDWLPGEWTKGPLYAGILVGGGSKRMGQEKHLLAAGADTWLERTVKTVRPFVDKIAILGEAEIPSSIMPAAVLPDVEGAKGPLAGMLSAIRWAPSASWLFLACDLPMLSAESIEWILQQRRPGVWAVMPQLEGVDGIEPLLAYYDFRAKPLMEQCARPFELAEHDEVITPTPPSDIASAWTNVNTPEELAELKTNPNYTN